MIYKYFPGTLSVDLLISKKANISIKTIKYLFMKNFSIISVCIFMFIAIPFFVFTQGNIGINNDNSAPEASAMLDVKSSSLGLLIPRMNSTQRGLIPSPANGLLVFDTDTRTFWYFSSNTSVWIELKPDITYSAGSGISIVGTTISNTGDLNGTDDITTGTLAGGDLTGSYPNPVITANSIGSSEIINGSIANIDLGSNIINADNIIDGGISKFDLADNSVTSLAVNDNAITNSEMADNAIGNTEMMDNAIGSPEIINGAVTMNKIFQSGATPGQVIKWNGSNWSPAPDDDTNTTYTAGSGISLTGTTFSHIAHIGDVTGATALTISNNAVNSAKIQDAAITIADMSFSGAAAGNVLTATGATSASWQTPAIQKVLADTDNDTKIQVEKTPDDDIIRFDLAGQERMTLLQNVSLQPRLEIGSGTNLAVGNDALIVNDPVNGPGNTAIGSLALSANTNGDFNTGTGHEALKSNTTGNYNSAYGYDALYYNVGNSRSTAIGYNAMQYAHNGVADNYTYDTAIGAEALRGSSSPANNTGKYNTAVGDQALYSNTSGNENTATGNYALHNNKANSRSTAIGYNAMYYCNNTTTGILTYNTALGYDALRGTTTPANNTGTKNTATGDQALIQNSSGSKNTANGVDALYTNTTGSENTAIGYAADVSVNNLTNATALGNGAIVNASNKVRIGNTAVTVVESQVGSWTTSDGRFKFDISENVAGLDFIKKLRPVAYNFNAKAFDQFLMKNMPDSIRIEKAKNHNYTMDTYIRQTGFIAQEVETSVTEGNFIFSGVHHPDSEDDNYSLSYEKFVVPLVKAVQEQQLMIEQQNIIIVQLQAKANEVDGLKTELEKYKDLESRIKALEKR